MAHDVFISYSQIDKLTADAACAALEAAGVRCWVAPRDIPAGMSWPAAIVEAIHNSRVMVLVFSSHAISSEEVQREVVHAFQNGVAVVPLRIEDVRPTGDMAYYMSSTHWLDAMTPPLAAHLRTLCQTAKAILLTVKQRQAAPAASYLTPATPEAAGAGAGAGAATGVVLGMDAVEPAPAHHAPQRTTPEPQTAVRPAASAAQLAAPLTEPPSAAPSPTGGPSPTAAPSIVPRPFAGRPVAVPQIRTAEDSAATSEESWPSRPGRVWPWPSLGVLRERRYVRGLAVTAVAIAVIAAITAEAWNESSRMRDRPFYYGWCFLFALFPLAGAFASLRWRATSAWRAFWSGVGCAFAAHAIGFAALMILLTMISGQAGGDKLWRLTLTAFWCGIAPCVAVGLSRTFLLTARRPELWPSDRFRRGMTIAAIVLGVLGLIGGEWHAEEYNVDRPQAFAVYFVVVWSPLVALAVSRRWRPQSRIVAFGLGFFCTFVTYLIGGGLNALIFSSTEASQPDFFRFTWLIGLIAAPIVGLVRAFFMPSTRENQQATST